MLRRLRSPSGRPWAVRIRGHVGRAPIPAPCMPLFPAGKVGGARNQQPNRKVIHELVAGAKSVAPSSPSHPSCLQNVCGLERMLVRRSPLLHLTSHSFAKTVRRDRATRRNCVALVAQLPVPSQWPQSCHPPSFRVRSGAAGTRGGHIPVVHHTFHSVRLASFSAAPQPGPLQTAGTCQSLGAPL